MVALLITAAAQGKDPESKTIQLPAMKMDVPRMIGKRKRGSDMGSPGSVCKAHKYLHHSLKRIRRFRNAPEPFAQRALLSVKTDVRRLPFTVFCAAVERLIALWRGSYTRSASSTATTHTHHQFSVFFIVDEIRCGLDNFAQTGCEVRWNP